MINAGGVGDAYVLLILHHMDLERENAFAL